jgi:hypothetical protein
MCELDISMEVLRLPDNNRRKNTMGRVPCGGGGPTAVRWSKVA